MSAAHPPPLDVLRIGFPVSHGLGERLQRELVAARIAGSIPDVLVLLEHAPVVTLGLQADRAHIRLSRAELSRRGIAMAQTRRGGDVTFHGPGQLVAYPVFRLDPGSRDVHAYMRLLEDVAITTAAEFGVTAYRRPGLTGAWTDGGKIAAIGVRFQRWVASHGMSFNVSIDLAGFDAIVPCGLAGEAVTSLGRILGACCPSLEAVREVMVCRFLERAGRRPGCEPGAAATPGELARALRTWLPAERVVEVVEDDARGEHGGHGGDDSGVDAADGRGEVVAGDHQAEVDRR